MRAFCIVYSVRYFVAFLRIVGKNIIMIIYVINQINTGTLGINKSRE